MEPNQPLSSENVKVIEWEDFDQELARLWSLSSALNEAKEKKISLEEKLNSLLQVVALFLPACTGKQIGYLSFFQILGFFCSVRF